jgi:hypothetical protein
MTRQERRSFSRYRPPESLVAVVDFPTRAEEHIRVESIGLGGLCFTTKTDISGESFFNLSLKFDDADGPSLRVDLSAKIVWHIHDEATALHTAGAQFVEPDESASSMLREFLSFLESQGYGEAPAAEQDTSDP